MNEKPNPPSADSLIQKAEFNESRRPEQKELQQAVERLQQPLAELNYDSEERQTFEIDGNIVSAQFRAVPAELSPQFETVARKYLGGGEALDFPEEHDIGNWRWLSHFALEEGDSQNSGENILPKEYVFLINPTTEYKGGLTLKGESVVLIGGDMTAPSTIITVLHEIGHIRTPEEKLEVASKKDGGRFDHYLAERLQSERMANAFVLKHIRSLLNNKRLKDDILLEVLHQMQGSYDALTLRSKADNDRRKEENERIADNLKRLGQQLGRGEE